MKHAPIIPPQDDPDEELSRFLMSLPPPPGVPVTDEEVAAAEAEAEEDIVAGRVYDHAVVSEWFATWGDADLLPFEEWYAKRHG